MALAHVDRIFAAKASRAFASGCLASSAVYLDLLGIRPIYIGTFVLVIVASGVFLEVVLSRYESRLGRRFFISLFSRTAGRFGHPPVSDDEHSSVAPRVLHRQLSTTGRK